MNDLMCVPNFMEGRIIIRSSHNIKEKMSEYYQKGYYTSEFSSNFRKVEETDNILQYIEWCGINYSRFLETRKKVKKFKIWKEKTKQYTWGGILKTKQLKCDQKIITVEEDIYFLRESCLQYFYFKVKDIKSKNIEVQLHRTISDRSIIKITKDQYLHTIKQLEVVFEYYTERISNSTPEESFEYMVKRLMQTDIKFKSHIEMRKEKEEKK